jgi:GxxExxY protein
MAMMKVFCRKKTMLEKKDLIYPELSYRIIGCAFEVFNSIGGGHKESVYQNAMAIALKEAGLKFTKEQYYPVKYNNIIVGKNFFDFYIENKIVVELKSASHFSKANYDRVLNYLNVSKMKLALLLSFGAQEVRGKRIVNFNELNQVAVNPD